MAQPNPALIEEIPGRLCADPTSLSGTYPFGGTALGDTKDHRFSIRRRNRSVEAEEWGRVAEVAYVGESAAFLAVMRNLDSDLLALLFGGLTVGAATGRAIVEPLDDDDEQRAGRLVEPITLYFSPFNDQHHGILIYRAVPLVQEAGELALRLGLDPGLAVAFEATPDQEHAAPYAIGLRADLAGVL